MIDRHNFRLASPDLDTVTCDLRSALGALERRGARAGRLRALQCRYQLGAGSTRYIGPATLAAINSYLVASGHTFGPLFRRVLRGGSGSGEPLGADSIRKIVRQRVAAVTGVAGRIGGHSLRVGSARELAAAGASVAELQQAGGWRSPATPEVYIRREVAVRGPVARRRYQVGK